MNIPVSEAQMPFPGDDPASLLERAERLSAASQRIGAHVARMERTVSRVREAWPSPDGLAAAASVATTTRQAQQLVSRLDRAAKVARRVGEESIGRRRRILHLRDAWDGLRRQALHADTVATSDHPDADAARALVAEVNQSLHQLNRRYESEVAESDQAVHGAECELDDLSAAIAPVFQGGVGTAYASSPLFDGVGEPVLKIGSALTGDEWRVRAGAAQAAPVTSMVNGDLHGAEREEAVEEFLEKNKENLKDEAWVAGLASSLGPDFFSNLQEQIAQYHADGTMHSDQSQDLYSAMSEVLATYTDPSSKHHADDTWIDGLVQTDGQFDPLKFMRVNDFYRVGTDFSQSFDNYLTQSAIDWEIWTTTEGIDYPWPQDRYTNMGTIIPPVDWNLDPLTQRFAELQADPTHDDVLLDQTARQDGGPSNYEYLMSREWADGGRGLALTIDAMTRPESGDLNKAGDLAQAVLLRVGTANSDVTPEMREGLVNVGARYFASLSDSAGTSDGSPAIANSGIPGEGFVNRIDLEGPATAAYFFNYAFADWDDEKSREILNNAWVVTHALETQRGLEALEANADDPVAVQRLKFGPLDALTESANVAAMMAQAEMNASIAASQPVTDPGPLKTLFAAAIGSGKVGVDAWKLPGLQGSMLKEGLAALSSAFSAQIGNGDWITGIELSPEELQKQIDGLRRGLNETTADMMLPFLAQASSSGVPVFTVLNDEGIPVGISSSPQTTSTPAYVDPATGRLYDWETMVELGVTGRFREDMASAMLFGSTMDTAASYNERVALAILQGRSSAVDYNN